MKKIQVMGGCSVHGCSNQSKDGFRLYRFPSGPYRRQQWVDKIVANLKQIQGSNRERGTWEPTHNHRICEVKSLSIDQFDSLLAFTCRNLKYIASFDPPTGSL